jgi:hypothetical protein
VQSVVVTEVLKAAARAYGHKMRAGGPCSTQDSKVGVLKQLLQWDQQAQTRTKPGDSMRAGV